MKKISLFTLTVLVLAVFSFQIVSAQFPKIKIPKPSQPQPTPADTAQPTSTTNTQPAQPESRNPKVAAATGPTINKPSIRIWLQSHLEYFRNGQRDEDTWSWTPAIDFRVNGPLVAGSQISVEYSLPTNKSWLKFDCKTEDAVAGSWAGVELCGQNPPEEKAVTYSGPVDFKINLKNELEGTSTTLFAGKFKVEKLHVGVVDLPKFKNNFTYYVNYDGDLPIGYVYPEDVYYKEKASYKAAPASMANAHLYVAFSFKGNNNMIVYPKVAAYLYYQGKMVAQNVDEGSECELLTQPDRSPNEEPYGFCRRRFKMQALVWAKSPQFNNPQDFKMYENPGEYEVKILQNGKLARTAKFTMGANGQLVETGIGPQNNLGTGRIIVTAQIIGDQDGQWDRNAYKTDAFFGNPLSGFVFP